MLILFWDTETSGLPLWGKPSDDPGQPHIVDISAELVDDQTGEVVDAMDYLINPGVPIPPEVSAIHGITDEMVKDACGPKEAITRFLAMEKRADLSCGHNLDFDKRMVRIQVFRLFQQSWDPVTPTFCTMQATTKLCRILKKNARSDKDFKWPKLTEAVKHLFGEEMPDAHRVRPDMLACKRIYFHLNPIKEIDHG